MPKRKYTHRPETPSTRHAKEWSSSQVIAWRERMGLHVYEAAMVLGMSRPGYGLMEQRGAHRIQVLAMKYLELQPRLYALRDLLNDFDI